MILNEEQKFMPLRKLEKYIIEWIYGARISYLPTDDKSGNLIYQISDINGDIIYRGLISQNDSSNKERAILSTDGILNDELKGCVEQCVALDIQIEEYRKASERQTGVFSSSVILDAKNANEDSRPSLYC